MLVRRPLLSRPPEARNRRSTAPASIFQSRSLLKLTGQHYHRIVRWSGRLKLRVRGHHVGPTSNYSHVLQSEHYFSGWAFHNIVFRKGTSQKELNSAARPEPKIGSLAGSLAFVSWFASLLLRWW